MIRFRPGRRLRLVAAAHLAAALAGLLTAYGLSRDLPGIENLNENLTLENLSRPTELLDRHGRPFHSFAERQRIVVRLDQISPWYLKAIIATEDPRFYRHFGVDAISVVRAALKTITTMKFGVEGASTITMQLARQQFLSPEKTLVRKIREAILATHIERRYSKQEILTLYCNSIYLGHGQYGVEAASRFYFGKPAAELTLPEAALLAGLTQMPENLTPIRYPERARRRRNKVLQRMVEEGVLDPAEARRAMEAPVEVVRHEPARRVGEYFVEQVRRFLAREFGQAALYRAGYLVQTTLDPAMQIAAERAVAVGLDEYGRRHQQIPEGRPLPEGTDPASFDAPEWHGPIAVDDILPAVVEEAAADRARVRVGDARLELDREAIAWTEKSRLDEVLRPGTVVPVRVRELDGEGGIRAADLASRPSAQAALIAMDVDTGAVRALVGGRDFRESEFDRAMQARRQAGSAFKPFVYAAALEQGFLPTDRIYDAPLAVPGPPGEPPYQPENYERDYRGYVTLRFALEHSRNIPTVRLLDALGYRPAVDLARRLGIGGRLRPYPSLALGAFEVRLADMVAAYASFANGGILVEPHLIEQVSDATRQPIWRAETPAREVLSPEVAGMMVSLLEGVVERGTGRGARVLGRPVAGKTGTTDEYTDAWFIGFTPRLAVGVWVGHDQRETLGPNETGARAALPIWVRFLRDALAGTPPEEFTPPPGLVRVLIDGRTGRLARRGIGCSPLLLELLPVGRDALPRCDERQHLRLQLPYPLQRYPIRADGALLLPPEEAARLVARAPDRLRITGNGRWLAYRWGRLEGAVRLAWGEAEWMTYLSRFPLAKTEVRLLAEEREERLAAGDVPAGNGSEQPPSPEAVLPPRLRVGVDGWPVEVLEVNRSGRIRWPELPADP
ncbi:MAG: PBP1A family penicillin-binding protein [Acidobacteria bacterium]|nr:MAG: PBP1A family penicillin-binding protein [Acidobacteriota bacterium]